MTEPAGTEAPPVGEAEPDMGKPVDHAAEAEKWKALSRKHEADAKAGKAAAARLAEIEAANASDLDKATAKARDEGKAEVMTAANARLVKSEARALAAEAKFRNPTLAVSSLDLSAVTVADDGTVDAAAIKAALEELAKSDPYLVGEDPIKPPPFNGGPRATAGTSDPAGDFAKFLGGQLNPH